MGRPGRPGPGRPGPGRGRVTRCAYGGGRLEHEHKVGDRGVEHGHANGMAVELTLELGEHLVRVRAAAATTTTAATTIH